MNETAGLFCCAINSTARPPNPGTVYSHRISSGRSTSSALWNAISLSTRW